MKSTTHRYFLTLRLIALTTGEDVRWTSTREIISGLRSAGYDCTVRTVQRDLRALADDFCLTVRKSKGRLYEWARHKPLEAV